jgi:hypothetical protein
MKVEKLAESKDRNNNANSALIVHMLAQDNDNRTFLLASIVIFNPRIVCVCQQH